MGTHIRGTNAPANTADPQVNSAAIVTRLMISGAATPKPLRLDAKWSGPLITFAKPCCKNPKPTTKRAIKITTSVRSVALDRKTNADRDFLGFMNISFAAAFNNRKIKFRSQCGVASFRA